MAKILPRRPIICYGRLGLPDARRGNVRRERVGLEIVDGTVLLRPQRSLFEEGEAPIGLDEFQDFTTRTDRNARPGVDGLGFVLLGLFGEVGSLLSALKKKQRDRDAFVAYHDDVIEELGDSLWYLRQRRTSCRPAPYRSLLSGRLQNWTTGIIRGEQRP